MAGSLCDEVGIREDAHTELPALLEVGKIRPRDYQIEMVEESLEKNIIVAMGTGSGKTLVAVLRIASELERCAKEKFVWFLAPSVVLCEQQHAYLSGQLPAYPTRLLIGSDKVERWSDQTLWDQVLKNVRIVVSTHQVLLDALSFGFVRMSRIAMLVFDEAHHCAKNHPANLIMQRFYHPFRGTGAELPHILGLSASPGDPLKGGSLETIERNLNALSKAPKRHGDQLLEVAQPPVLEKLVYPAITSIDECAKPPAPLGSLMNMVEAYEICNDPYVKQLMSQDDAKSREKLQKVLMKRDTRCLSYLKTLERRSIHIWEQLGAWACNYYIIETIDRLRSTFSPDEIGLWEWEDKETLFLLDALRQVDLQAQLQMNLDGRMQVSEKTLYLLRLLVLEYEDDFSGLVFVQQRPVVAMLCHIISKHPLTSNLFKCATFVGNSMSGQRNDGPTDLLDVKSQAKSLDELRDGRKNLIIATNVLEEGIDVSSCHIVISFHPVQKLMSFIQRRGRARKMGSKFVIMIEDSDKLANGKDWQQLEEAMKRAYLDENRNLEVREAPDQDEDGARQFSVPTTGALLTLDNALPLLHHFCATLPRDAYVDCRPEFSTHESSPDMVRASVTLPSSVDASVRLAASRDAWRTERMAFRDAAFQAYLALYQAKLVNDNLLPLWRTRYDITQELGSIDKRPSMLEVCSLINPLVDSLPQDASSNEDFRTIVSVQSDVFERMQFQMYLPLRLSRLPTFQLFWNSATKLSVSIDDAVGVDVTPDSRRTMASFTHLLLNSVFWQRMDSAASGFATYYLPDSIGDSDAELGRFQGCGRALDVYHQADRATSDYGIIRDSTQVGASFVFQGWVMREADIDEHAAGTKELHIEVLRVPKRRDFLHPVLEDPLTVQGRHGRTDFVRAANCTIDNLPYRYSRFALFVPSILHRCQVSLLAEELRRSVLPRVDFATTEHIITAISASSAGEMTNYQRLEFLGDSTLKLCASIQLLAEHPTEHEGYLSARKDRVVSNERLARAAKAKGLDKYILTQRFTGRKWRPLYQTDGALQDQAGTRKMSTKILADVVEALIGAAYMEGGFSNALACLAAFLPEVHWLPTQKRVESLYAKIPSPKIFPAQYRDLERLADYTFRQKTLLMEAVTHPSYNIDLTTSSYQRLEFLGDSILDHLIVSRLFDCGRTYSQGEMYWLRAALVNADFLAFICLEWNVQQSRADIKLNSKTGAPETVDTTVPINLWRFMRHSVFEITKAQRTAVKCHEQFGDGVKRALASGAVHPWGKLAAYRSDKFFSDLIESLLGAVFLDSGGDIGACAAVAERMGILPYLQRVIDQNVDLVHPKGRLGMMVLTSKLEYKTGRTTDGEHDRGSYWCEIWKDRDLTIRAHGGSSEKEMATIAAEQLTAILSPTLCKGQT